VSEVSKAYGKHIALKDVSFCIDEFQAVGLLGENGAGKTTLLDIISGCLLADSGSVTIDGFDIVSNAESAKHSIGYLPEKPPLYTEMTVFEYLKFCIELKRVVKKDRNRHLDDLLETANLTQVKNRKIANLSHGFRQRVGFAQALCGNPKIILLDEPTNGLDPSQVIEFKRAIKTLSKKHILILSSHILSLIQSVCDRVLILHSGVLTVDRLIKESNSSSFFVSLYAPQAQILSKIRHMPSVKRLKTADKGNPNITNLIIETDDKDSLPKELFSFSTGNGIAILRLQECENTLEELYQSSIDEGTLS
jgi:ABC-2 type transport system ATP-binding protein